MTAKITQPITTEVKVKCKLCNANITFDVDNNASYLSKTKHLDFFGMMLITYRIQHIVNGEKHLNAVLIDQQNLFRGYIDAYKIPVKQEEKEVNMIDYNNFMVLEEEIKPLVSSDIFTNFFIVNLNGWILEVVKLASIKTEAVLKNIFDKIEESKSIYENIPQPLSINVANLEFFIWIEGKTHLILTFQKKKNRIEHNKLFEQITKNIENNGIIPKKRLFMILNTSLQESALVDKNPDLILRLLSDDLYYSKIKTKYPERIMEIIPKISKRHSVSKNILKDLLLGKYSVIELFEKKPELIVKCKEITETLNFINRRKLLD